MIGERLLISLALMAAAALLVLALGWHSRRAAARSARANARGQARLLYFRGPGCPACAAQSRILAQLEPRFQALLTTIDVEQEPALARAYNVLSLPTTIVIGADGAVRRINYGLAPLSKLAEQLRGVI